MSVNDDRVSVEVARTLFKVMPNTAQLIEQMAEGDDPYPTDVTR